ncbi:MAG: sulfatase [bacterium]|nr:sulfatase [bacterium]
MIHKHTIRVLVCALVFFVLSCGKTDQNSFDHVFLLKQYTQENLVKAPDLKGMELPGELKRILESRNNDRFLPPSPFIKKVKCLTETRSALFAPAGTTYEFSIDIKKGARLTFGFAIDDIYSAERRVPIEFDVLIENPKNGNYDSLYSKVLFSNNPANLGWHDQSIAIDRFPGTVKLKFVTRKHVPSKKEIFAYWSNLTVLNPAEKKKKPNLILISLDTLRADHLDIYNYKRATAPQLGKYLPDFVMFKHCWSQWCRTSESHHSIMTGLYEAEHRVPDRYKATPSHLVTLAELMKGEGYITAAFTGASKVSADTGLCKGFDSYYDNESWKGDGLELPENWQRAKKWLGANAGNDFFLFFHTYQIHGPYKTSIPQYDEMFNPNNKGYDLGDLGISKIGKEKDVDKIKWFIKSSRKQVNPGDTDIIQGLRDYYDGAIKFTNDYFFTDFFAYLKQLGIYDNTIIVILSDHGEEFFEHGSLKHKDGVHEVNIHVPLLIKLPYSEFGGKVIDRDVQTIDVFPTLSELFGIKTNHPVSGRSLVRPITGKISANAPDPFVFSQSPSWFAVKKGNMKLILKSRLANSVQGKLPRIKIYDLAKDPNEKHPVKIDHLSQYKYLYDKLFQKLILKKRGIHIVFSEALEGKTIEGEIDIPRSKEKFRISYEIGAAKNDVTLFSEKSNKITFNWKMSNWKKSLILVPREKFKIRLKLKIDGKYFKDITLDKSILKDGEYLTTSGKHYTFGREAIPGDVFIFGNSAKQSSKKGNYYPGMSKKNLEKLKTLGYIQ